MAPALNTAPCTLNTEHCTLHARLEELLEAERGKNRQLSERLDSLELCGGAGPPEQVDMALHLCCIQILLPNMFAEMLSGCFWVVERCGCRWWWW